MTSQLNLTSIIGWLPLCAALLLLAETTENACPPGCECLLSQDIVDCTGASLGYIPWNLPKAATLKQLIMSDNEMQSILKEIVTYGSLNQLDISDNQILIINDQVFLGLTNLQLLDLHNNKLTEITDGMFEQGITSLVDLDLSSNEISSIQDGAFRSLSKLTRLRLSNNQLSEIRMEMFTGLHSLQYLYLDGNLLTNLNSNVFHAMPGLKELYLDQNELTGFNDVTFTSLSELTLLELEGNQLRRLPEYIFSSSKPPALKKLSIKNNQFGVLPSKSFSHLINLNNLDISHNPFISIDPDAFNGLQDLVTLTINDCQKLAVIREYSFNGLINLRTINISRNRDLEVIEHNAFIASHNIKHLQLTDNALQTLEVDLLLWLNLETLALTGNRWRCDCALSYLPEVLQAKRNISNRTIFQKVRCSLPSHLAQTSIIDLEPQDFNCDILLLTTLRTDTVQQFSSTIMIAIICAFAGALLTCLAFLIWRTRDVSFHNNNGSHNHINHRRRRLRKINREYSCTGSTDIGEGPSIVSVGIDKPFATGFDEECGDDDDVFLNDPDIVTSSQARQRLSERCRKVSFSDRVVVRTYESIEEYEETFDDNECDC